MSLPPVLSLGELLANRPPAVPDTPAAALLRPFLDLSAVVTGSLQTWGIEACYAHATSDADYLLPIQSHPAAGLRDRIAADIHVPEYQVNRAADLPAGLRTGRWQWLVDTLAGIRDLPPNSRLKALQLCSALGLDRDVAETTRILLGDGDAPQIPRTTYEAALMMMRTRARRNCRPGESTRMDDHRLLIAVAGAPGVSPLLRLNAALTLVVHYSKSRMRDITAAADWRRRAERLFGSIDPDRDWRSRAYASAYWRAVSFVPFHQGRHAQVVAELDRAENHARALPAGTMPQRVMRGQFLHPLLETRTREALWLGDADLALRRTRELVAVDPLEPKVHVQLGDLLDRAGAHDEALRSYRAAAWLGSPYTTLARFKIGRLLSARQTCDRAALAAFVQALRAEPRAVTCAAEVSALARRLGDPVTAQWADTLAGPAAARNGRAAGAPRTPAPATDARPAGKLVIATGRQAGPAAAAAVLLRPYLDLGEPPAEGPNHSHAVLLPARAMARGEGLTVQGHPSAAFRAAVTRECRLPRYHLGDPRDLPGDARTALWSELCERLGRFGALPPAGRTPVIDLCRVLGYYPLIVRLLEPLGIAAASEQELRDDAVARQAILLCTGWHKSQGISRVPDIERLLRRVAEHARPRMSLAAAVDLVVHHAKQTRSGADAAYWAGQALRIERLIDWAADLGDSLTLSAMYRGVAYRGFLRRDAAETGDMLGLAGTWADAVKPQTPDERVRWTENARALNETRSKVLQIAGDTDAAIAVHRAVLDMDPLDSRVHVQHGDLVAETDPASALPHYLTAVRLGAPASGVAWTKAGRCYERLGDGDSALDAYLAAVDADPHGVSCVLRIRALAAELGRPPLEDWARRYLQHQRDEITEITGGQP